MIFLIKDRLRMNAKQFDCQAFDFGSTLEKEVASKCLWPMEPPVWANLFLTWHRDYLRPLISPAIIFWHHDAL